MTGRAFEIKGGHVLAAMLAFFAVVIGVNATFITLAVRTFPGEVTPRSYVQGLAFNDTLAAKAEQARRGWTSDVSHTPADGGHVIAVRMRDAEGRALDGLALEGVLRRPATAEGLQTLRFEGEGGGRYVISVKAEPGAWRLDVRTAFPDGAPFNAEAELWLP